MKNTIRYKDYSGTVEFSEEDGIFFGKVLGIRTLISYGGESAKQLTDDFHRSVDDYLRMCSQEGIQPEKPFRGSFNIRISPELHRSLYLEAMSRNMTLNRLIQEILSARTFIND